METCLCGTSVEMEWNYCPHCGERLIFWVYVCPRCNTMFEDDHKEHFSGIICPECHKKGTDLVGVLQRVRWGGNGENNNVEE